MYLNLSFKSVYKVNFSEILYDKYDFDLLLKTYMDQNKIKNTFINNLAYYLQGTNILNNYYLIVPIKISF